MQTTALLVDDSRVARMTLKKLLVAHEFDVIEVGSGEEALIHLQSSEALPDIIFMDVMMGGVDGLTATRQIKADSKLSAIPVVICTGNDTEADIDNALATGAMAVLSKPPAADALASLLAEFEQQRAIHIEPEATVAEPVMASAEPEATAAAPVIDQAQLAQTVMAQIEQQLLPEIKRDMRDMAEDISRQVAADTAEHKIESEVKAILDNLMPAQTEQLMAKVTQVAETTAQQLAKQTARDTVSQSAENAVKRIASELDLSALAVQTLSSEGTLWLKHQQQQLLTQLSQALELKIQTSIDKVLEDSLEQRIAPLVIKQVNTILAEKNANNEAEEQAQTQTAAIARLNKFVLVLGLGLVAVAGAVGLTFLQ